MLTVNIFFEKDNKKGVLDQNGDVLLEPIYDRIYTNENYFFARKNYSTISIYNSEFKKIIDGDFSKISKKNGYLHFKSVKTGKAGVLDSLGNTLIPANYDYISNNNNYYDYNKFICVNKNKFGVVDKNNNIIIPFEYSHIIALNDVMRMLNIHPIFQPVEAYFVTKNSSPPFGIGILDSRGKIMIPTIYEDGYSRLNNDVIPLKKKGKFGFVTLANEEIIPFQYDDALSFSYGVASVQKKNQFGLIDINNKIVVPFDDYLGHFSFHHGLSKFAMSSGKFGLINTNGQIISNNIYDDIIYIRLDQYFRTKKSGKHGIIDFNGKEIIPCKYSFAQQLFQSEINGTTYYQVGLDGKVGVVDQNHKIILDFKYESVGKYYDRIIVRENGKHGILDLNFKTIQLPKYPKMRIRGADWISVEDEHGNNYIIDSFGVKI